LSNLSSTKLPMRDFAHCMLPIVLQVISIFHGLQKRITFVDVQKNVQKKLKR
jgi:hypothetical protein